jgi:competence protein ComEC
MVSHQKRFFIILFVFFITFVVVLFFARKDLIELTERIKHFFIQNQESVQDPVKENFEKNIVTVTFLDIGQGDASFLEFADGTQMLVDCAIDARILEALGRVMSFRDHTIDYMVVTHPDKDHYGGCIDVLKRFEVKNVVVNGFKKEESSFFRVFEQAIQDEKSEVIEINKEQVWTIASSTIHFLYPDFPVEKEPILQNLSKNKISNNTSIVFLLQNGDKKVLFTGDAELETENYLIKKFGLLLDSDVLKVGHHGSNSSSGEKFLQMVSPEYATISVGKENSYGHPSQRIVNRLKRVHSSIWRTDQKGDIIITIEPNSVYVTGQ